MGTSFIIYHSQLVERSSFLQAQRRESNSVKSVEMSLGLGLILKWALLFYSHKHSVSFTASFSVPFTLIHTKGRAG